MKWSKQDLIEKLKELYSPSPGKIFLSVFLIGVALFVVVFSGLLDIDDPSPISIYYLIPINILFGPNLLFDSIVNDFTFDLCFIEIFIFFTWLYTLSSTTIFTISKVVKLKL